MIAEPLISVLMPVFNAESYITDAFNSIIGQTYKNLEILLTDDGSTDNTKNILDRFKDCRIKRNDNPTNIGYLRTCNKLFSMASGEFFAFQDADDWSDPTRIEAIMKRMLSDDALGLCGCNYKRYTTDKKILRISKYPEEDQVIRDYFDSRKKLPLCGASVIVRKSIYEMLGGYREFYCGIGYEHLDWFLLASERYKIGNISAPLYNYRYIRNSFSLSNKLIDYKKFYVSRIAMFLMAQRKEHGADALQDNSLKADFDIFLNNLEKGFWSEREEVYRNLVNLFISSGDYAEAFSTLFTGIRKREIKLFVAFYLLFRMVKCHIGFLFFNKGKKFLKHSCRDL